MCESEKEISCIKASLVLMPVLNQTMTSYSEVKPCLMQLNTMEIFECSDFLSAVSFICMCHCGLYPPLVTFNLCPLSLPHWWQTHIE